MCHIVRCFNYATRCVPRKPFQLLSFNSHRAMSDVRWAVGDERWAMGDGRWAMSDGRWAVGDERWAMGGGRWA